MTTPDHELMLPAEVARLFGVARKTVERWADVGLLQVVRTPGGHRRYIAADVRRLYEQSQRT